MTLLSTIAAKSGTAARTDKLVMPTAPVATYLTAGQVADLFQGTSGGDVASAATTDIGAAPGMFVRVTGTTTITGLGTADAGVTRLVLFAGALTLTHNATSLILPTGANITTAAGDAALFVSAGSGNWRALGYWRANGTPLAGGGGDVAGPAVSVDSRVALFDGTTGKLLKQAGKSYNDSRIQSIIIACGDENTAITAGTAKVTFRMPYAFTLTDVRASLKTAQASGSIFTVDVNENGTTILPTKLTIDNTEKTSTTAATPPVISDTELADDSEITIDVDQIGASGATGLKVALIGYPT